MPEIVLTPARHDSPASIVAALGAADYLRVAGDPVAIRWVESDGEEWRPALLTARSTSGTLAECIASDRPLRRDVLPKGGKGQSLRQLVLDANPDLKPLQALIREEHRLLDGGNDAEARLLTGVLGVNRDDTLGRSPLARGAKSDVVQATRRRARGVTPDEAYTEITGPQWAWGTEESGDWGLCAERHIPREGPAGPRSPIASPTLARLLTRGIMANPLYVTAYGERKLTGGSTLTWPIWTDPLPPQTLGCWWMLALHPTYEVSDGEGGHYRLPRLPSARWWMRSVPIPISRMLSVWGLAAPGAEVLRRISKEMRDA